MINRIVTLATPHLIAQAISPSHFQEIHRLHTDPKVMKTLSADGKPVSEKATRKSIRQSVDHWQQHGFGLWVFRRTSDRVAGSRSTRSTAKM